MTFFCSNCHMLLPADRKSRRSSKKVDGKVYCPDCAELLQVKDKVDSKKKLVVHSGPREPFMRLFPFDEPRKGQDALMKKIYETMTSGKHLVVHAPTGLGKTVSVLTPGVQFARKNEKKLFFLTSRQTQHRIAVDTLKKIDREYGGGFSVVDIISKHRMCPRQQEFRNLSYSMFNELCKMEIAGHKCKYYTKKNTKALELIKTNILHADELVNYSKRKGLCPYKLAMELGSEADVIICDYNYIFSDINELILPKFGVDFSDIIVVVDEAHNLAERIRSHLTYELSFQRLAGIIRGLKGKDKFLGRLIGDITEMIEKELADVPDGKATLIPKTGLLRKLDTILHSSIDKPMDVKSFREYLLTASSDLPGNSMIKSQLINFEKFLESWEQLEESSIRYADSTTDQVKLIVKVLDPAVFSKPIFKSIASGILMSGTLYPPQMYGDLLGLSPEDTVYARYSSPFPEENRLIVIDKTVTTTYKQRNMDMYYRIAGNIHRLLELVPGNMAVFFTSYELQKNTKALLEERVLPKKLLVEKRELKAAEKNALLKDLRISQDKGEGSVLLGVMGGSMAEGIDYPDQLLSGIIIVGIPIAPPSVELSALSSYFGGKFGNEKSDEYCLIMPAMNKVMQAAGRSIRSESDKSIIVLMDSRFTMQKYQRFFPDEYKISSGNDLGEMVHEFFS